MSFNNYSKFGNKNKSHQHVTQVNNSVKTNVLKGKVVNCDLLRVRKEPSLEAEELTRVSKDSELVIISSFNESDTFYKIMTPDGIEGYCMKDFISLV